MKFLTIFLLFLCISVTGCSQKEQPPKESYSVDELKSDFLVFRAALEEAHPGLYRYHSKKTMDSIFDAGLAGITSPMSETEFMLLIDKIVVYMGDGHTAVVPSKFNRDKLDEDAAAIPFQPYIFNNKMYVQNNLSELDDKELLGAEIISINKKPITQLLAKWRELITSDGKNETFKFRRLERYRFFTRYLYFVNGHATSFEIEYTPMKGTVIKKATLAGLTFDELFKRIEQKIPALLPAEFRVEENNLFGYLRIAIFDKENFKDSKMDFPKFLEQTFKEIQSKNINNLILDLRGNPGGTDEYGRLLYSYFAKGDFDYYQSLKMNKETYDFFKYTSHPGRKAPKGMLQPNNEGTFDDVKHPNVGKQKASSHGYTGNIFVLINGACFSTTSEFLSVLHSNTNAVFIGEESGGGYVGNCSSPIPEMFLPNTKLRIDIPLRIYNMAVKETSNKDRGIMPHHFVKASIADKVNNVDSELEFVKKLIRKQ